MLLPAAGCWCRQPLVALHYVLFHCQCQPVWRAIHSNDVTVCLQPGPPPLTLSAKLSGLLQPPPSGRGAGSGRAGSVTSKGSGRSKMTFLKVQCACDWQKHMITACL